MANTNDNRSTETPKSEDDLAEVMGYEGQTLEGISCQVGALSAKLDAMTTEAGNVVSYWLDGEVDTWLRDVERKLDDVAELPDAVAGQNEKLEWLQATLNRLLDALELRENKD